MTIADENTPDKSVKMDPAKYLTESFDAMSFDERLDMNLKKVKYGSPTPIQKCSMKLIADGYDIMACAETGSGKTAAFLLPGSVLIFFL